MCMGALSLSLCLSCPLSLFLSFPSLLRPTHRNMNNHMEALKIWEGLMDALNELKLQYWKVMHF